MSSQDHHNSSLLPPSSTTSKIFHCTDNIPQKLLALYEQKELFDIVLITEDDEVKVQAHRVILAASSDYFLAMFRSTLIEANAKQIVLKEVNSVVLQLVVDFMYTGSIELCSETVESVLQAADIFQMNTLTMACCDFIEEQLDERNCLGFTLFAERHNYTGLYNKSFKFACTHFEKVRVEEEFFRLNEEQLIKYISSEDLRVQSEENLFTGLVAWIEHDREKREKSTLSLLSHVRFSSLQPKFIIENRHSVCKTIECCELLFSWLQWHSSPENRTLFAADKPERENDKIAFVNGTSTHDLKLQILNPKLNTLSQEELPPSLLRRMYHKTIIIDKKLIVVGGRVNSSITNCVDSLDLQTKTWSDLPPITTGRCHPGLVELNGDLYVVGGFDGKSLTRSVEKYNFSTGKWQEMAPLNSNHKGIKVAALDGRLYAFGNESSMMECYDPIINKWSQKLLKYEKSKQSSIAAVSGHLYAVGGLLNGRISRTVERYHPATDTWTVIAPLELERPFLRCAALNDRLIVCVGHDGLNRINLVEEYNPKTEGWKILCYLSI